MGKLNKQFQLRSVEDLTRVHEWLLHEQRHNRIDVKTAGAINQTLRGAVYLQGRLKLEAARLFLTAQRRGVKVPLKMFPVV